MKKSVITLLMLVFFVTGSIAQEVRIPHEFKDGQPASASQINENFRVLGDSINSLGAEIAVHRDETSSKDRKTKARLEKIERLIRALQNDVTTIQKKKVGASIPRDPVNDVYGQQETEHLTAMVTKLLVNSRHDVTVFMKYKSKSTRDFYLAFSGNDYRNKSYLVDDRGNIYRIDQLSGIDSMADGDITGTRLLLKAGSTASFSFIFGRPRNIDVFGEKYTLSLVKQLGTFNADGRWRRMHEFNISIGDIHPTNTD
uniref:Uncharacterized protein n=1 Tax=Candidatus Kentrum sp. TUN TaxID=2126343 RepID=A0A450ZN66_9GAMM|nr:MAG: hypothetical protein BECKTUN1418D_GA0071000_102812 [Candidatus Kentron sp. TUN]